MLTGVKAFVGESITDVLAHVVEREPGDEAAAGGARAHRRAAAAVLQKNRRTARDIADARA
jgi:hypothetical protein